MRDTYYNTVASQTIQARAIRDAGSLPANLPPGARRHTMNRLEKMYGLNRVARQRQRKLPADFDQQAVESYFQYLAGVNLQREQDAINESARLARETENTDAFQDVVNMMHGLTVQPPRTIGTVTYDEFENAWAPSYMDESEEGVAVQYDEAEMVPAISYSHGDGRAATSHEPYVPPPSSVFRPNPVANVPIPPRVMEIAPPPPQIISAPSTPPNVIEAAREDVMIDTEEEEIFEDTMDADGDGEPDVQAAPDDPEALPDQVDEMEEEEEDL